MIRVRRAFALHLALLAAASSGPMTVGSAVAGPAPGTLPQTSGSVVVNMRGVDIRDVSEQIARITGRTIVLDPAVSGTVTVVSAQPLGSAGVWDLYLSMLRSYGYAAVRSGDVWRVVPQASVVQNNAVASAGSQQVVTRLFRLRNLAPDQAVRALRSLISQFGSLEATTGPDAVIVTDYADNVARLQQILQALDDGESQRFETITLANAQAEDVAASLARLFPEGSGPRIAVDTRSNALIIRAEPQELAQMREVVSTLDQPGGAGPATRVVRLNHGDAESVVEILRGVLGAEPRATNPVARALRQDATGLAGLSASARAGVSDMIAPAAFTSTDEVPVPGFQTSEVVVQAASELNAVILRGAPAALQPIVDLIDELDMRRPQVTIEAAIVEITGELGEQLGIQLAGGALAPATGAAGGTTFSNTGQPLNAVLSVLGIPGAAALTEGLNVAAGRRNEFSVLLQALSRTANARLLSTPSVTVLDNEPAEIVVGQNVPFRTGSFSTDGNTVSPFTTISREDVGVSLRVTPRVHDGDVVRLEVTQEVSSLVDGVVLGAADLVTNRRSIQTTVLADDGETITLGGLIADDRQGGRSKVPVLGDLPGVGLLFRSTRESSVRRTLFIFLRPTILRDAEDVRGMAVRNYDRLRSSGAAATDGDLAPTP